MLWDMQQEIVVPEASQASVEALQAPWGLRALAVLSQVVSAVEEVVSWKAFVKQLSLEQRNHEHCDSLFLEEDLEMPF